MSGEPGSGEESFRRIGGLDQVRHEIGHQPLPDELASWWRGLAETEIERTVPKAQEYGSTDLRDIGRTLATVAGRGVSDEEAVEIGIYFYLVGKLARWTDSVKRGDRPSDDTLFDIGVYVRMAQRNRAIGGWPNKAGGQS